MNLWNTNHRLTCRVETLDGLDKQGIEVVALDVCKPDSIKEAVERVLEQAGKIDVLINNAGFSSFGPLIEQVWPLAGEAFHILRWKLPCMCPIWLNSLISAADIFIKTDVARPRLPCSCTLAHARTSYMHPHWQFRTTGRAHLAVSEKHWTFARDSLLLERNM